MKSGAAAFAANQVLCGHDDTPGLVAGELVGADRVREYRRVDGKLVPTDQPFRPFLWLPAVVHLQGFPGKAEFTELAGGGELKVLARFESWREYQAARKFLGDRDTFALNDPIQQYLTATGRTLFKGLRFEELHRLQLDLTRAPDGSVRLIQLADNRGWQQELSGDEPALLRRFVALVVERDPDVIEGLDIFRRTLALLAERARARRVPLALGRDGSRLTSRPSRIQIAERTIQYPKHQIHGRHIVDTFLLAQFYDIATRELEGFDREDLAEHFELTGRPAVEVIRGVADLLSPSYFIQAQIFPYNYQDVVVRGNATKIDALFLREHYHRRHAIPLLEDARFFAGGYTDLFHEGILANIWHADVQSLYPSLILAFDIKPRRDELNLFVSLLADLRQFRLSAKTAAREAVDETLRRHYQALQQTFKILINSFYGYLGFAQGHFSDFTAAETVTARGRELLQKMVDWLKHHGARVIEIDTDGLYFVPPPASQPAALEAALQQVLPAGVAVEIDGQFPAMFSYKMKNYALLDAAGKLHIKGSALRSRGLEKFQRQFLEELLTRAMQGGAETLPALYEQYRQQLEQRAWPIELLAKTETLQDSLEVYRQKISQSARNRSAAYELALQAPQPLQAGDRITYYVTGTDQRASVYENCKLASAFDPQHRDENVDYYLDKLHALYAKFAPLLAPGTAPIAPRKRTAPRAAGQGELFG